MLTCSELSELGSEIIEGHVKWRTRWALKMHLWMCPPCALYVKQLKLTLEVLQNLSFKDDSIDASAILQKLKTPDE